MSYPEGLIDKRVVDRYIAKGMVDSDQYKAHLAALPDMEHNATVVLQDEEADDDEEGDDPADDASEPTASGV